VSCDISCLIGYDEVADPEDAARTRPAWVSRRRFGPSLTFGWVWHYVDVSMLELVRRCRHDAVRIRAAARERASKAAECADARA
jgi:hypothetical protein